MKLSCRVFLSVVILLLFENSYTQSDWDKTDKNHGDSDTSRTFIQKQLVPIGLISGGIIVETFGFKQEMQEWFPRTNTHIEDYLRSVPIAELYLSDILGARHKNSVFNQTKYLIISKIATGLITQGLKKLVNTKRPNGADLAFPSGHTSDAFASATVLFQEFKDFNILLASSGYLFSTTTGVLRITNNKHWVSDVLAGAGIGILVTNLVYYFEPLKNWDPFRPDKKTQIIPEIDPNSRTYLVSLRIKL